VTLKFKLKLKLLAYKNTELFRHALSISPPRRGHVSSCAVAQWLGVVFSRLTEIWADPSITVSLTF